MKKFFHGASIGACLALLLSAANAALPLTWQVSNPPPTNSRLNAITYGNGRFVAVGSARTILSSENGIDWSLRQNGLPGGNFWSATFGNGMFVAGGGGSAFLASSADGINWSNGQSAGGIEAIYGLAFGKGLFVGVGQGPSQPSSYVLTSPNGLNWQTQIAPTARALRAVAFANNVFVAVGDAGTIITSADGTNWTQRISAASVLLRAVTFNGSRFIVAGDSGITLSSPDGISWSPAAPASFDTYALAAGGGAVVAAGNYLGAGRAQGSPDGLTWPGDPAQFSSSLFGVAYRPDYFVAVGDNGLIVRSSGLTPNATNSWTKSTSGSWQEPFWSLGELPNIIHRAIVFTNSGFNALAIDNQTAVNFANSLNIQNLVVDAPPDSSNLLLLNYAGLDVALAVRTNISIGPNGALTSLGSWLTASNLFLNGRATFAAGGQSEISTVLIGQTAPGELTLSNGWFWSLQETVSVSAPAVFTQLGGTNATSTLVIGPHGRYDLKGGTLWLQEGFGFPAVFVRSGNSPGEGFLNEGGYLTNHFISVESGSFSQTAGFTFTESLQLATPSGSVATASAFLSGGAISLYGMDVGVWYWPGTHGDFSQSGGSLSNGYSMSITEDSSYSLSGGRLDVDEIELSGHFNQTGGTNVVETLQLAAFGDYKPGVYNFAGGFLSVGNLTLSRGSEFRRGNVSFVNQGKYSPGIYFAGGTFFAGTGSNQIATLWVGGGSSDIESFLDLETGGASVLRFSDSHSNEWSDVYSGTLTITNWAGSLSGGGADRIYVGTNQFGLTIDQLGHIAFARPAGLTPANYPAKILSTGEIVPDPRGPVLGISQRDTNYFWLSWNANSFDLLTSTNVIGPYERVIYARYSPFPFPFSDPQRFFKLRSK